MAAFRPLGRRDNVLKSGTTHSGPASFNRLVTSLWSAAMAARPAPSASGTPGSPHRRRWQIGPVCRTARPTIASQERTRSATNHAAWVRRCRSASYSTGIRAEGEGEWFAKKHGPSKPRQWRKVHLGIDADTLEIRAIEVTGSRVGDVEPVSATGSSEPARDAPRIAEPDPR